MLMQLGVCGFGRLHREIRIKLPLIENIFARNGAGEPVITSVGEGDHSLWSLHYTDPIQAIDFRKPVLIPIKFDELVEDLEHSLPGFDIVTSGPCIHIEYDPKE